MSENFSASFLLSFFRHLSARTLQLLTIGSSLLSVVRSARSSDGYTTMVGAGSWAIRLPSIFSMADVPPTWVGFTNTISSTVSSEKASMISTRYGVTLLLHGPGIALPSGSTRYFAAHSETVRRSAGRST